HVRPLAVTSPIRSQWCRVRTVIPTRSATSPTVSPVRLLIGSTSLTARTLVPDVASGSTFLRGLPAGSLGCMTRPAPEVYDRLRALVAIPEFRADPSSRESAVLNEVFTGEPLAEIPVGTAADVETAVERARAAQVAWAERSAKDRAAVLVTLTLSNHSGGKGTFVLFSYINAVYLLPYAVLAVPVATVMFPALSTWVGRTRTPEATEAERIEAGARLRGLTSTTTALILAIGGLGAVILLSAAGPLQTFFTAIDAAKDVADVPFDSMGRAIMV